MTQCPYCLSEVDAQALVCRTCTRDIHLFRPLLARIAALELQLAAVTEQVSPAETKVDPGPANEPRPGKAFPSLNQPVIRFRDGLYVFLPLPLLWLAHWFFVIEWDLNLLYLRLISIAVPLPFGFALLMYRHRSILPWLSVPVPMAVAAVLGMSGLTSWVDHTSVLPQNTFEWREFSEYVASVALSFVTGMLLALLWRSKTGNENRVAPQWVVNLPRWTGGAVAPREMATLVKRLEEFGGSLVAIGTTAMSIYTGLKGVLG